MCRSGRCAASMCCFISGRRSNRPARTAWSRSATVTTLVRILQIVAKVGSVDFVLPVAGLVAGVGHYTRISSVFPWSIVVLVVESNITACGLMCSGAGIRPSYPPQQYPPLVVC